MTYFTYFAISYLGHVLDEADTREDAEAIRDRLVDDIFAGRVPGFLTEADFDSREDARTQLRITEEQDDQ